MCINNLANLLLVSKIAALLLLICFSVTVTVIFVNTINADTYKIVSILLGAILISNLFAKAVILYLESQLPHD